MGPRRWSVLAAALFGPAVIAAAPAGGSRPGPVARVACAGAATGSCTESGKVSLPPNSFGSQSTDTVPSKSASGTVLVAPLSGQDLADFDATWETIVDVQPHFGKIKSTFIRRVLTCAVVAPFVNYAHKLFVQPRSSAAGTDVSDLFLSLCIQMVVATQHAGTAASAAASGGCAPALVSMPVQIQQTGRTYGAQVVGTPQQVSARTSLAVSCRAKGSGIQIGLRPRARRTKLRQLIGPHLRVGFANPASGPVAIRATYTFTK